MDQIDEYLNSTDKYEVITYKSLSRLMEIPVNKAKELLLEYATKNPSDISVLYCLMGTTPKNSLKITLVEHDKLDNTKKTFSKYSFHVYSIQKKSNTFSNECIIQTNFEVMQADTLSTLPTKRVISSPWIKDNIVQRKVIGVSTYKPAQGDDLFKGNHPTKKGAPVKKSVGKKSVDKGTAKKIAKPAATGTSFFSDFASMSTKPVAASSSSKEPSPEIQESRVQAPKKTISPKKPTAARKKMTEEEMEQSAKLEGMFDSDNNDDEKINDDDVEMEDVEKKVDADDQEMEEPKKPSIRVKKRKRIVRKERYMDGKYMKSRDVSDWEEYSESEPEPPVSSFKPLKKPAPKIVKKNDSDDEQVGKKPTKKNGKKDKNKGNQSILSFFGRN